MWNGSAGCCPPRSAWAFQILLKTRAGATLSASTTTTISRVVRSRTARRSVSFLLNWHLDHRRDGGGAALEARPEEPLDCHGVVGFHDVEEDVL